MKTSNPPIDAEHLLSHAGFLRGLAYGLVTAHPDAEGRFQVAL